MDAHCVRTCSYTIVIHYYDYKTLEHSDGFWGLGPIPSWRPCKVNKARASSSEDPQRMTRLVSQSIWRPLWMIWEPEHIRAYSIVVIWCHFLVARFCWPELNQDIWAKVCERFVPFWDEEGALQLVTKDSTNRECFTTRSTFSSWPCDTLCLMYFHTKTSCLTVVCMYNIYIYHI